MRIVTAVALFISISVPLPALATPGGLNAQGCHNSKTAGYHCHRSGGSPSSATRSRKPTYSALGGGGRAFANCSEARAAGAAPVMRGDPGYAPKLDRDGDGVGCE